MIRFVVLFLLFACIGSCDTMEDPINRFNKKLKIDTTGVLRMDIPKKYNDSSAYWYFFRIGRKNLGLPSLENGSEAFEIRIGEELDWGGMILNIKYKDRIWSAENYTFWADSTYQYMGDTLVVDIVRLGTPKSGWKKFLNKLIDKGILDLRDASNIPGYFNAMDLPIVDVEIATKNYYRYYHLPDARDQSSIVSDAKSIVEILDLIKDEFPEIEPQLTRCSKIAVSSWKGESPARDSSLNQTTTVEK